MPSHSGFQSRKTGPARHDHPVGDLGPPGLGGEAHERGRVASPEVALVVATGEQVAAFGELVLPPLDEQHAARRTGVRTVGDGAGPRRAGGGRAAAGVRSTRTATLHTTQITASTRTMMRLRRVVIDPTAASCCSTADHGTVPDGPDRVPKHGLRVLRPVARAPGAAPRLRHHAGGAGRAGLRGAGRSVGRPALPSAGDGGAEGRGPPARPVEPVPAERASTGPGSRTSTTRRCAR